MPTELSPEERIFWQATAEAAFANPFGDQRRELDSKIIGETVGDEDSRIAALREVLIARSEKLEKEKRGTLGAFAGEDREIMRIGFLFEIFHRFCTAFDEVIAAQIKSPGVPCPVPFAGQALASLRKRGFTAAEAVRFFGIFYQLRRAHHFIIHGLIGQSPSMKELRRHLWNNVFTYDIRWYDRYLWNRMEDFSTLLLGETGTGKGAAAAAIGRSGFIPFIESRGCFAESFAENFISLNLSQFPETLIESELFGHKKGAFTGAIENHQGAFARCSPHGAIFLDEIGDVSVPVQIKLLQVLQERTFSPVGSHEKIRFRGRVIAATNKPLGVLREKKLFRDDFFYRLCSDSIVVPPLRQRLQEYPAELDALLAHMVHRTAGEPASELVQLVRQILIGGVGRNYAWPGNVRELEQAVRQILLTRKYQGDPSSISRDRRSELITAIETGAWDAEKILAGYCSLLYERHGTFQEVSRRTNLDFRTVKKYLQHRFES
jgi:DNA-binding NtrC family response regulator